MIEVITAFDHGIEVGERKELIRCKDCYYYIPPEDRDIRNLYSCRESWNKNNIGENDFCSRAIRKDDVYRRRKKGTWEVKIRHHPYPDGREYKKYCCSVCGNDVDDHEDSDFCPWCGADMRKDGEHK